MNEPFDAEKELIDLLNNNKISFSVDSNQSGKHEINFLDLIGKEGYPSLIYSKLKEFLDLKKPNGNYKIEVLYEQKKIPLFFEYLGIEENVNVNKTTTTPYLPTTHYYIKSWGLYDKENKIFIEQITPEYFFVDVKGKKGLVEVKTIREINESGEVLKGRGFEFEGIKFLFKQKNIYEARLFYNIPSLDLVNQYIEGNFKPRSYSEISKDVIHNLQEFFDFKNEVDIQTTNIFIGQSWIKPILTNFFFFGIDSTFGGGKTTLGELVYLLVRHGFVGGNISSASIPRLTDELDLNVFVDEIDQNQKDDDMIAILRKGQRRGNPYVRCEGRDNRPVAYDLAGCHGFSFRTELEDAFMNRSLRVHTIKSKDYRLPVINSAKKEFLKPLADELFIWYLDNIMGVSNGNE